MMRSELIAHRGASHAAPENTLAAFRLAWSEGADGIEGDFRLTRDGEIVCIHDPKTRRTAGVDLEIASATLAELKALDVGSWKGSAWAGERIPALSEVLALLSPGKHLFIELKGGPEIVPPLARILAESGRAPEETVVLSFGREVVARVKTEIPCIRANWITDYRWSPGRGWSPSLPEILAALEETGADGLASEAHRFIDASFVRELRQRGKALHVWTVDNPADALRFASLGVDSIVTNRPGLLRERLASALDTPA